MPETSKVTLDINKDTRAEDALFTGKIQTLAVTLYENERPPGALAGILDWHCFGMISHYLKVGALTGKLGECSYFPFVRRDQVFNLVFLGAGKAAFSGARLPISPTVLQTLHSNLLSLRVSRVGLSQADFGNVEPEVLSKQLKGTSLWIMA